MIVIGGVNVLAWLVTWFWSRSFFSLDIDKFVSEDDS